MLGKKSRPVRRSISSTETMQREGKSQRPAVWSIKTARTRTLSSVWEAMTM